MPDHLERRDAGRHRGVADVAAQSDAARRPPVAHAGGDRRLRLRTARQHDPGRPDLALDVAVLHPRADDGAGLAPVADRRDEAHRREHPRPRSDSGVADDLVEALPRQHGERAGHVDASAARRDAAERRRHPRLGHHLPEHAKAVERTVGVGDEAIAADLVARERLGVDEDDVATGAGEPLRGGAAGRAGADDEHVAALRQERDVEIHAGTGLLRLRTHAQRSDDGACRDRADQREGLVVGLQGLAGVRAQPPLEDGADQGDAERAAKLAQEVDGARTVRDEDIGQAVHRAQVQRRQDEAEADAADHRPDRDEQERRADADAEHQEKNDAASRTRPRLTSLPTETLSASRPAIGIVSASAMPAGSSTTPACDGGRRSASCMKTGTR